jgi:hypothetical protein
LPHLLVLHHPATRISYWAHVTKDTVTSTGQGFKIFVPVTQRVDSTNRGALLDVAASAKNAPTLQGTSFKASVKAVAPGRALRHALLTPRLIAPHPNTGYKRTLEPEEAVALLTQGRIADLERFAHEGHNPKLASAAATSRDWGWRFFAAYRELVTTGDRGLILKLASMATNRRRRKEQSYRIGACAVTAAVALIDVELWDEAQAVLLAAGEDLPPIDHAWVLVQRAVVLAEQGDLEAARNLAATALRTLKLDADDVTAGAISAAAASLIFETTVWGLEITGGGHDAFSHALTASDTAAAWWRSQMVSRALGDHDHKAFEAWANCDDVDDQYLDNAQNRLHGAGLAAALAGARGSAAATLATRAHHDLVHHEVAWRSASAGELGDTVCHGGIEVVVDAIAVTDVGGLSAPAKAGQDAANGIEEALDELRRYGRHEDLDIAARRLWAAGPAAPLRVALQRSVAAPWTHTNAHAKLTLLHRAGDLLDTPSADQAVQHCLNVLVDPMPFAEQVRPTFSVTHYVHQALRRMLAAASDAVHDQVVEYLLQCVADGDDVGIEESLVPLIACVRPPAITARAEAARTAALNQRSDLAATMLGALLAGGDREAESELMRRADGGDRHAVIALGSAKALSDVAAATLIQRDTIGCRQLIAQARNGTHRFGGWDSARALTVANLTFPALATWEPVVEVVLDPFVAADHKINAMHLLALRANDLPDNVASALRVAMSQGVTAVHGPTAFQRREDLVEAAFALGLALGVLDTASAVRRILSWLRGAAAQRRAAGGLLGVLGRRAQAPVVQGALVMLTSDPQYRVWAAAAAALTRGATSQMPDFVEEAVLAAAREAGCAVPLSVGQALQTAPETWPRLDTARAVLATHMSARVRVAAGDRCGP